MQQDLDKLAARLGQLAQRARQLHTEREALRSHLATVESERGALKGRIAAHEADLTAMHSKLQASDGETALRLTQAQRMETSLREQLSSEITEREALAARYTARETELVAQLQTQNAELQRLRAAAQTARERIDAVLTRLPGAPSGESH